MTVSHAQPGAPTAISPLASRNYSRSMILMHWLMALLIAAAFATIELRELFEKGTTVREGLKSVHYMIGISVLALVLLRLMLRAISSAPSITPPPPAWQTGLSHATHAVMYVLMAGLPILGWLMLSAAGKPIPFDLPTLVPASKDAAEWYKEMHETAGDVFMILIGLHAAAALAHHYLIKDNTLTRMLPRR